ncbi:hypothetical protein [Humibacillus xanthopallidus]|uniref:hypothetical protein n=1 Tax=Humibacillus xanthopallidus TaxID=412689 RepID=UPI003851612F
MQTSLGSRVLVAAIIVTATGSGCGPQQGNPEARDVASVVVQFRSHAVSDVEAACALLAPESAMELEQASGSCGRGLTAAHLADGGRVRDVEVYGLDAMVRLEQDTVFLARFDDGWRITAAGCTPRGDGPYDCDIKGG